MNKKTIPLVAIALVTCILFLGLNCEDTEPPTVSITSPADSAEVSGNVTITADADDNEGVSIVDFYVDDTQVGDDGEAPYEYLWDASGAEPGSEHTLEAAAYDEAGNEAWDSITVTISAE